jgi:hypothetical protein
MIYTWNNEPIPDIYAWARERGEQMVRVRKTWTDLLPMAGQTVEREEIIEMPASFFGGMRFGGMRNENYTEVERFDP